MRKAFLFLIVLISIQNLQAANSLSYSGRLVQVSGAPVTGPVNLRAELVYTNATSAVLCSQNLTSVALTKGVFHLKLDLNCTPKTITQVLAETPNGESVAIRIIDQTNSKTYPLQAIHSVPFSKIAEQLPQMGASSGQALAWDGSKWSPTAVGTGNGTVTNIVTGTGLTGGPISTTGTISVAAGGITSTELAANSVTASKINAGEITNSHISATAAIPYSKLSIGVGEIPQDRINGLSTSMSALIEDVIADAVTGKAPSQNAVYDALNLKADRSNVAQNITAASVVGLTAPTLGSAAANRDYVDNSATNLDTRITNEVATINTTLGTKYDKAGGVITGDVTLNTQLLLKGGSNFVTVKANSGTANYTMTLPTSAGTSGYVLQTDGAGVLSWVNPSAVVTGTGTVNSASITDGAIVDADINASANIAQSKIAGLATSLSGKENTITAGTTAQYYRGDKTWQTLNTAIVPENTNLYFTEQRVRDSILTGVNTSLTGTISATDSVLSGFGKAQKQLSDIASGATANQWTESAGNIYRNSGNVGIGITNPEVRFQISNPDESLKVGKTTDAYHTTLTGNQLNFNRNGPSYIRQSTVGGSLRVQTSNVSTHDVNALDITASGNVGVGVLAPTEKLHVVGNINAEGKLRLKSDNANYVELSAPNALAATLNYILPGSAGTTGQVLTTNGTGTLSWSTVATTSTTVGGDLTGTIANAQIASGVVGSTEIGDASIATADLADSSVTSAKIVDGTITNADIANTQITYAKLNLTDGDIPLAKLNGASDATKYLRGDKTWSTFATDAINSVLSTFTVGTGTKPAVTNTDTVVGAFGKVQKTLNDINADYVSKTGSNAVTGSFNLTGITSFLQIPTSTGAVVNEAANVQYVQNYVSSFGVWNKNASNIYYDSGFVGVGLNSPLRPLHISNASTPTIVLEDTDGTANLKKRYMAVEADGDLSFGLFSDAMVSSRHLTLSTSGNLGINSDNPNEILHVRKTSGAIRLESETENNDNSNRIEFGENGTDDNFVMRYDGAATQQGSGALVFNGMGAGDILSITRLGRIGVGTTNPQQKFVVQGGNLALNAIGNASPQYEWRASDNSLRAYISHATETPGATTDENRFFQSYGYKTFYTQGAERLRIDAAGNVGIGTTTPSGKLDIWGVGVGRSIRTNPSDSGYIISSFNNSASDAEQFNIKHLLGNVEIRNERGNIGFTQGNVGVGTVSPGAPFHVLKEYTAASASEEYGQYTNTQFSAASTNWKAGIRANTSPTLTTGTLSKVVGVQSLISSGASGGTTTDAIALWGRIDTATGQTITNSYGVMIEDGGGTSNPANLYGLYVRNLTKGTTQNFALYTEGTTKSYFGGNVGIGQTTPGAKLDVNGNVRLSGTGSEVEFNAGGPRIKVSATNTLTVHSGGGLGSAANEVVRIDSSGNMGVGTATPQAKLEVAGGIKLGSMTACTAAQEGSQRYNSTLKIMEFCDGVAWQSFAGSSSIPTGAVMAFDLTTCPSGWSEYTQARGRFLRGIDNGAGVDPAGTRAPGNIQAEDWRGFSMTNTIQAGSSGYSHGPVDMGKSTSTFVGNLFTGHWNTPMAASGVRWNAADETRPTNVAVLFCRKN